MDNDALIELEIAPITAVDPMSVDYAPSAGASPTQLRFGDEAAALAEGVPAPSGDPGNGAIPAYSLQAPGGGAITPRDIKAAGVGAGILALFLWVGKMFSPGSGRRDY